MLMQLWLLAAVYNFTRKHANKQGCGLAPLRVNTGKKQRQHTATAQTALAFYRHCTDGYFLLSFVKQTVLYL
jgi:hypothetical protein